MKIIIYDENNNGHHIAPSDLTLPECWNEEYTFEKFSTGYQNILKNVDIQEFTALIVQSLDLVLADINENPHEPPDVINRFLNLAEYTEKIFHQSVSTIYHLQLCSSREDWYEEMVDFIEYNEITFGLPSTGYNQYLIALLFLIGEKPSDDKLFKTSQFIQTKLYKVEKGDPPKLNRLMEMFEEWWCSIPFDLEYLKPLQDNHDELKALLFLVGPKGDAKVNRYSGATKTSVFSIPEIMEALCRLTDEVTRTLNLLTLHDNQQLTEIGKYELGLTIATRRKKLALGYSQSAKATTPEYQEIWQTWLGDEIAFFGELQKMPQYGKSKDSITFTLLPEQLEELKKELGKVVDNPNRLGTLLDEKAVDGPVVILEECSQNKFCEIFKRLSYNGYVSRDSSEIKKWLKIHFLKENKELGNQPLGDRTLRDLFEASAKPVAKRFRDFDWLIYKTSTQLTKEAFDYKKDS